MKRLKKRNVVGSSIEAYACVCGSRCSTTCGCVCLIILGDKQSLLDSTKQDDVERDSQKEATATNYRK